MDRWGIHINNRSTRFTSRADRERVSRATRLPGGRQGIVFAVMLLLSALTLAACGNKSTAGVKVTAVTTATVQAVSTQAVPTVSAAAATVQSAASAAQPTL